MTRFIFFDPIFSQAGLLLPLFSFLPRCILLPLSPLQSWSPSSTLLHISLFPSSCGEEGELALGTWVVYFHLVYPLITASFLLKKEMEKKRRKWRARRVQPLVAPSIGFITLAFELASLRNKNTSFYGFIGLGFYISKKLYFEKHFKLCFTKDLIVILFSFLSYNKCSLPTYWKFFHPPLSQHSHCKSLSLPLCHLLPSFSHCLSVWQMAVKAVQMGSSKQVNKQAGINIPGH